MTIDDKSILLLAEKLEKGLKEFSVGLALRKHEESYRWYSPNELLSRIGAIMARSSSDPHLQAAGMVIFGSLHLFGIKGTVQLILKLRRKNAANAASKTKGSEAPVSGVRNGSDAENRS